MRLCAFASQVTFLLNAGRAGTEATVSEAVEAGNEQQGEHAFFAPENLNDQEQARMNSLHSLVAAGIDPYPARVTRTHTIAEARALHEAGDAGETSLSVTGRIKGMRAMGKMSFVDLEDGTGRIQILLRRDDLPAGWYDDIWKKLIDLGDFLGVTGPLVVTQDGRVERARTECTVSEQSAQAHARQVAWGCATAKSATAAAM